MKRIPVHTCTLDADKCEICGYKWPRKRDPEVVSHHGEKKLHEVIVTMYVMAKSETEAKAVAIHDAGYELDICEIEAHEAISYYSTWQDAIPFGSDDDLTVGEIMAQETDNG